MGYQETDTDEEDENDGDDENSNTEPRDPQVDTIKKHLFDFWVAPYHAISLKFAFWGNFCRIFYL